MTDGVGRPRQRLVLDGDPAGPIAADELVERAASALGDSSSSSSSSSSLE